jgi:transmembrane sensor
MTQNTQRIDLEAAQWAVRLDARPLTGEEQAELDQWLAADSRHSGALLRARAGWVNLDRLAALAGRGPSAPPRPVQPSRSRKHTFANRRFFLAASLATLVIAGAAAWWIHSQSGVYRSGVGEVRNVTLSDGSRMVLNTATEATVRFDKALRQVDLAAGEGLFQVAKDPARPFVVRAGSLSVRAVGTVFDVRAGNGRVDVTVTEGVVELVDNTRSGDNVIRRVAANEHASVMETRQVAVQSIPHDEAQRRLAWRDGMVDFAGEPLTNAVEEINRHNYRRIVVDDPSLASRPVVGLFRATDPDGFAATVATALGADSAVDGDTIHLRAK